MGFGGGSAEYLKGWGGSWLLSARSGRNSVKAPVLLPQRNIAVIIPALYINRFICLMFILFSLHTASGNNPWSGSQLHPSSVGKTRPFPPPHITADSEPVHSPLYAQKNLFRTAAKSGPGFFKASLVQRFLSHVRKSLVLLSFAKSFQLFAV